eukprot:scaffold7.g3384.t1
MRGQKRGPCHTGTGGGRWRLQGASPRRKKRRLDEVCLERHPEHSRNVIQSWIAQGKVLVNDQPVKKAGHQVGDAARVEIIAEQPKYVCRAGLKLEAALDHFGVAGRRALDSGLSTGGFTDCLLQRGAASVVGVDVGYGQASEGVEPVVFSSVAERVRTDPRVTVMERTNLRHLRRGDLPGGTPVDLVTLDLSFISLLKLLDAVCDVLAPWGELVVLIKPQFEAGKAQVSVGGVVRDPAVHREVIARVVAAYEAAGFRCQGWRESPIKGATSGNTEFLAHFKFLPAEGGHSGGGSVAADGAVRPDAAPAAAGDDGAPAAGGAAASASAT